MFTPTLDGDPMPNLRKDLHLAIDLAHQLAVDVHVGSHASQVADDGNVTGTGDPEL
jgi:hypothetical protein